MPKRQDQQANWLLKAMDMAFAEGKGLWAHSLLDALEGLTAEQGAWRPRKKGVHSIWGIVNHITSAKDYAMRRLEGESAIALEEWPKIEETSEEAWAKAVARLKRTHNALMKRLREKEFDFDKRFPGERLPTGEMLFGVLAHDLYHTGQILLLRQLQGIGLE